MKKWVLMISQNNYPEGDAGAIRDEAFASIYSSLGYKVVIVCQGKNSERGSFNEHSYISLYKDVKNLSEKIKRYVSYKKRLKELLEELIRENGKPKIIHLYDAPTNGIKYIKQYAQDNSVLLVHDSVEWYSPEEFKLGRFDKSYILKKQLNTKLIDSQFRVIAISKYLEQHFLLKECRVTRIPVVMNVLSLPMAFPDTKSNITRISYAGSPANKDYLGKILEAISLLDNNKKEKVEVRIIGITKEQALQNNILSEEVLNRIEECTHFLGRVSRNQVIDELCNSHYTILVRPKEARYARAGFPTKIVESLAVGVPVICNYTSDLGQYLVDGENSIEISSEITEDIMKAVERAIDLSKSEWERMHIKARDTAEEHFYYQNYVQPMKKLLEVENDYLYQ